VRDLEQSLRINKEIIENLLRSNGNAISQNGQAVIHKMREENDHLYVSLKKAQEERLIATQKLSQQAEPPRGDKAAQLQQVLDRQQVLMDQKENSFIDLYSLALARVPKGDKLFMAKLQDIIKLKQRNEMAAAAKS
jgi:hypothetical protein